MIDYTLYIDETEPEDLLDNEDYVIVERVDEDVVELNFD